tara:strand:- start:381 stop:542 length:162 start_codon:yes stop_codon:yes gene_type:complete
MEELGSVRNLIDSLAQHRAYSPTLTIEEGKEILKRIVKDIRDVEVAKALKAKK